MLPSTVFCEEHETLAVKYRCRIHGYHPLCCTIDRYGKTFKWFMILVFICFGSSGRSKLG